jgi:molecular chaperone Hsp33
MSYPNELNRYLFNEAHARGELVQLNSSFQAIIKNHNYPKAVETLLGELLSATCLLTATLKFEGDITVQLQGDGPLSYMSVNGNHQQQMRGIAKLRHPIKDKTFKALVGKGTMIITIRPKVGEAYQGVVALDQDSLAGCLEHYFAVSEQIPTKIWLFSDSEQHRCAGTLVQLLPDGDGGIDNKAKHETDFEHLCQLTNTLKAEEVFTLNAEAILYRLYHQEQVNLFEPQLVTYLCGCSAEKCLTAISQVPSSEIKAILAEQGKISMTCDYCLTTYDFDETDLHSFISKVNH